MAEYGRPGDDGMISAFIKGFEWYRADNELHEINKRLRAELNGVSDGYNGHNFQCYKTANRSMAIVIDGRGPAALFKMNAVIYIIPEELDATIAKLKRALL